MARANPHHPPLLPPDLTYTDLITEIGDAREEIGNLSGSLVHLAVNPQLLITPLITNEAVVSSSIAGTAATLKDVFKYEIKRTSLKNEELKTDAQEIVNYRIALADSLLELDKRAIGENLVKKAHTNLLDSVRGSKK